MDWSQIRFAPETIHVYTNWLHAAGRRGHLWHHDNETNADKPSDDHHVKPCYNVIVKISFIGVTFSTQTPLRLVLSADN